MLNLLLVGGGTVCALRRARRTKTNKTRRNADFFAGDRKANGMIVCPIPTEIAPY